MIPTINSRPDLESLRNTEYFAEAIRSIAGTMAIRINIAEYPDGYGEPDYEGPEIEPVWEEREDLATIKRFGFTKAEIIEELENL